MLPWLKWYRENAYVLKLRRTEKGLSTGFKGVFQTGFKFSVPNFRDIIRSHWSRYISVS